MLVIRFRRIGKKNKPTYRLTVAEHTKPVNGSFVADVGFYNPHTKVAGLQSEEILEWLKKGAQPSNSVAKLLEREKIKHNSIVIIKKNKKSKKAVEENPKTAPVAPAAEAKSEETVETASEVTTETAETNTDSSEQAADTETPTEAVAESSEESEPAESEPAQA